MLSSDNFCTLFSSYISKSLLVPAHINSWSPITGRRMELSAKHNTTHSSLLLVSLVESHPQVTVDVRSTIPAVVYNCHHQRRPENHTNTRAVGGLLFLSLLVQLVYPFYCLLFVVRDYIVWDIYFFLCVIEKTIVRKNGSRCISCTGKCV